MPRRPSARVSLTSMRLPLLLLLVVVSVIHAFQPATPAGPRNPLVARRRGHLAGGLYATTPKASEEPSTTTAEVDVLKGAAMLDLCLEQHRPLGCTVEEALGKGYEKLVFVSKIVPGGCAAQAGIQVGDVVVGVSSLLGDDGMEDVARAGIDRVKSLVAAITNSEPLDLRLARGTTVLAAHEAAVVELCSQPDRSYEDVDECVVDFLQAGYWNEESDSASPANDKEPSEEEDNLLENMFSMWAEDLPDVKSSAPLTPPTQERSKQKPWSSRSSGSGTFVRDPKTGKMTNLDA